MDQSLENNFPVDLKPTPNTSPSTTDSNSSTDQQADSSMFYHNVNLSQQPGSHGNQTTASTNKPSALQRIYELKKAREEKEPDKYKHRLDYYADKPNNDPSFWKVSESQPDKPKPTGHPGSKSHSALTSGHNNTGKNFYETITIWWHEEW